MRFLVEDLRWQVRRAKVNLHCPQAEELNWIMSRHGGILICDDSDDDVLLLKHAFRTLGVDVRLDVVSSGNEALMYLMGEGGYAERELPRLVFLDIKMPGMDGLEVLEWLRGQAPPLKLIPVIMLSSSDRLEDIDRAHDLGCNGYVVKSVGQEALVGAVEAYWLAHNRYPSGCGRTGRFGVRAMEKAQERDA